jgi:hypothetical protein
MKISSPFILLALVANASANAAQYCVSSDTGLVSALNAAAASAEPDEIRLVQGNININTDIVPNQINGALSLRGGYLNGCTKRVSSASKTALVGTARSFHLFLNDDNLLIERLDFVGQSLVSISGNIANPLVSMILVTRSGFLNAALHVESFSHDVRVENSLFVGGGLRVAGYYTPVTERFGAISIVNCTAVNAANGISILQGATPVGATRPIPLLLNTISYGNTTSDLDLRTPTLVSHSIYKSIHLEQEGALTAQSQQNLSVDPQLDANHRPSSRSRAIDSGSNDAFVLAIERVKDYAGNARKLGLGIDRGAYEAEGVAFPSFP